MYPRIFSTRSYSNLVSMPWSSSRKQADRIGAHIMRQQRRPEMPAENMARSAHLFFLRRLRRHGMGLFIGAYHPCQHRGKLIDIDGLH